MTPLDQARIERLRRDIARAEDRKRLLAPGTPPYAAENNFIAAMMQAIARIQSNVEFRP